MSFDVKIEEGGGVISLKVKIPFSLYISWRRVLVKPGREGLSVAGLADQGRWWGAEEERDRGGQEWGPWFWFQKIEVTDTVHRSCKVKLWEIKGTMALLLIFALELQSI